MDFFHLRDEADADPRYASDVAVLIVSGELDYSASPRLREQLIDRIGVGKQRVVIDLSAVTFIDSMAIGVLIASALRLRETGGSLRIACANENERVLRIFDIAGVANSIPLDYSREQAISKLLAGPSVAAVPAWVEQATGLPATAEQQLPAGQSGLAVTRKYEVDDSTVSGRHSTADHHHPGSEIDTLA